MEQNKLVFKLLLASIILLLCAAAPASATTWYIRADGGTRWSPKVPTGQCDGKTDAPHKGSGTNGHCAFNDYRFLWDDKSYGNNGWVIAGGDTVILDNTRQWRVGFDQSSATDPWCFGGSGPFNCTNPTIPAGTAAQHTRILGRNYGNCSTADGQPDPTKMSQIFGGHGVNNALNLGGAQFVEIQCIEVTRHSSCMVHGLPIFGRYCSSAFPIDDYDSEGIGTNKDTHDLLLQDMYIHGHVDSGIRGNIGGFVFANRVMIAFNGMSGWSFDDNTHDSNGKLKMSYVSIIGSGCIQEYPSVDPFPALVCYDQGSSGYGDGVGTQAGYGMSVSIDHSTFAYNTQDGLDLGHVDSGNNTLSITDSIAYGNMGGQFKWGPNFQNAVFKNNEVVANCARMGAPMKGAPSTYNIHLDNFCRANDAMSFNFRNGGKLLMTNNKFITYAPVTFDINCWDDSCANAVMTFQNNITLGYDNPRTYKYGGQQGGPAGFYFAKPSGKMIKANNFYFGLRGMHCVPGSGDHCEDPHFTNEPHFTGEADLDHFNFNLSPTSPKM